VAKKGLSDDLKRDLNESVRKAVVCGLSIPDRGNRKVLSDFETA